jgi:hypothetical protein
MEKDVVNNEELPPVSEIFVVEDTVFQLFSARHILALVGYYNYIINIVRYNLTYSLPTSCKLAGTGLWIMPNSRNIQTISLDTQ